ncbi:unnamed protein product [Symbiodinium necroappetens]|uniref:Sushi domain-containing protein n=1 Tax=Symbiodinium necroappetens TaxID=1628268 RepID=A0A812LTN1_9DINO|nr:unnamed protein product [Symbiodinium necroappetens]
MLCDDTPLSSAGFAEYVGRLTCLPDSSFNGTISEVVESSCPDRAQVTGYASTCQDKKPGDECCLAIASPSWVYCETGYTGNPAPYMCDADTLTFVAKDANASCVGSGGRRLSGSGGSSGSGVADGSICIAHCSRGYELVGVASVLTCNSGSLSGNLDGIFEEGTLPVCTPLPCTYNVPDAVGLQHNCSNVTPLEGTSLRRRVPAVLAAPRRYECQSDGNITGVLPDCVGNPCENTIPSDQAFSGEVTWKPSLSTWEFQRQNGPGDLTLKELLMRYELTSGAAGEVSGARSIKPGQPIVCPSLNPSDVLADNCTGLLAGQSCERRCRSGFLPANATSSSFNCDLSGQVSGDGATVSCEPVQCNSSISIPNVVHTCSDVFVNRSCFAYCREGFQLNTPEVPEWTCTDAASGLPAVSDVPMVDGYTLRGTVPVCSALPCLYNLPFGAEYADDCAGVVTDGTCAVTCAAGWQGGSSTWTCMPDGVLNGTYPECLEITSTATSTTQTATTTVSSVTTTSTTYWNGTVLFSGYLDVTPILAGRRLQLGRSELNEGFLNDTLSVEGLTHALAELLDVSETDVEINLTLGISNATQEEVVRPFFNAYRPFYTSEEAAEFANNLSAYLDSKPHEQVVSVLNSKLDLVDANYRIGELLQMLVSFDQGSAFVVEVRILPPVPVVVEPEEEDSNVQWLIGALVAVVVCACLLYFLYWIWNKDREEAP